MDLNKYKKGALGLSKFYLGIDKSDDMMADRRRAICMECPKLKADNRKIATYKYKCGECGCFMEPKIKIKTEKCPLNKW